MVGGALNVEVEMGPPALKPGVLGEMEMDFGFLPVVLLLDGA